MPSYTDITGQRFGRLIALTPVKRHPKRMDWLCRCDCGEERIVPGAKLRNGHTRSCGCLAREGFISRSTTHGHTPRGNWHPLYVTWASMISRCENQNNQDYARYGGRGITVCERWRTSFPNFLADMGERPPGTSLDRVNNELGYNVENCKWSSPKEQANNRGGKRAKPRGPAPEELFGSGRHSPAQVPRSPR